MNETELLFSQVLKCDRASLYQRRKMPLNKEDALKISAVLKRRICAEPLPYILGNTEFMGLEFKVSPDVLIPRQETEILVEKVISLLRAQGSELRAADILELGTGSGCIAVSLAKFLDNVRITATDISKNALKIAEINAKLNQVDDKIRFVKSDLFAQNSQLATHFDIIISNPPYIASDEIDQLQPEIKYEPRIALEAGIDGLKFIRRIILEAGRFLKTGGFLVLEIGFDQKRKVENIFKNSGHFEIIEFIKDYSGIDRVVIARSLWIN